MRRRPYDFNEEIYDEEFNDERGLEGKEYQKLQDEFLLRKLGLITHPMASASMAASTMPVSEPAMKTQPIIQNIPTPPTTFTPTIALSLDGQLPLYPPMTGPILQPMQMSSPIRMPMPIPMPMGPTPMGPAPMLPIPGSIYQRPLMIQEQVPQYSLVNPGVGYKRTVRLNQKRNEQMDKEQKSNEESETEFRKKKKGKARPLAIPMAVPVPVPVMMAPLPPPPPPMYAPPPMKYPPFRPY